MVRSLGWLSVLCLLFSPVRAQVEDYEFERRPGRLTTVVLIEGAKRLQALCLAYDFNHEENTRKVGEARDSYFRALNVFRICLGKAGQPVEEWEWHVCTEGSNNLLLQE